MRTDKRMYVKEARELMGNIFLLYKRILFLEPI